MQTQTEESLNRKEEQVQVSSTSLGVKADKTAFVTYIGELFTYEREFHREIIASGVQTRGRSRLSAISKEMHDFTTDLHSMYQFSPLREHPKTGQQLRRTIVYSMNMLPNQSSQGTKESISKREEEKDRISNFGRTPIRKETLPRFLIEVTREMDAWLKKMSTETKAQPPSSENFIFLIDRLEPAWKADFVQNTPEHTHTALRLIKSLMSSHRFRFRVENIGEPKLMLLFSCMIELHAHFFTLEEAYVTTYANVLDMLIDAIQRKYLHLLPKAFENSILCSLASTDPPLNLVHPKMQVILAVAERTLQKGGVGVVSSCIVHFLKCQMKQSISYDTIRFIQTGIQRVAFTFKQLQSISEGLFGGLWKMYLLWWNEQHIPEQSFYLSRDFVLANSQDTRELLPLQRDISYYVNGLESIVCECLNSVHQSQSMVQIDEAPVLSYLTVHNSLWKNMIRTKFYWYIEQLISSILNYFLLLYADPPNTGRFSSSQRQILGKRRDDSLNTCTSLLVSLMENIDQGNISKACFGGYVRACMNVYSLRESESRRVPASKLGDTFRNAQTQMGNVIHTWMESFIQCDLEEQSEDEKRQLCLKCIVCVSTIHHTSLDDESRTFYLRFIEKLSALLPNFCSTELFDVLFQVIGAFITRVYSQQMGWIHPQNIDLLCAGIIKLFAKAMHEHAGTLSFNMIAAFPFHLLTSELHREVIVNLLNQTRKKGPAKPNDGYTPFYVAALAMGEISFDTVEKFLEKGSPGMHTLFLSCYSATLDRQDLRNPGVPLRTTTTRKSPIKGRKRDRTLVKTDSMDSTENAGNHIENAQKIVDYFSKSKKISDVPELATAFIRLLKTSSTKGVKLNLSAVDKFLIDFLGHPDDSLREAICDFLHVYTPSAELGCLSEHCCDLLERDPQYFHTTVKVLLYSLESVELSAIAKVVVRLLGYTTHAANPTAVATGHFAIQKIMKKLKFTPIELIRRQPGPFADLIRQNAQPDAECIKSLEDFADKDFVSLLKEIADFVLPILVLNRDTKTIQLFATRMEKGVSDICFAHFPSIGASALCPGLVLSSVERIPTAPESILLLQDLLARKSSTAELFSKNEKLIVERMVSLAAESTHLSFEERRSSIVSGFIEFQRATQSSDQKHAEQSTPKKNADMLAAQIFLRHSFGILDEICGKLGVGREEFGDPKPKSIVYDYRNGMNSLRLLLSILGPLVSTILQKVQLFKPSAFPSEVLPDLAQCWELLIQNLPIDILKRRSRDLLVDVMNFCNNSAWEKDANFRSSVGQMVRHIVNQANIGEIDELLECFPDCIDLNKILSRGKHKNLHQKSVQTQITDCIEALRSDSAQCRQLYLTSTYERLAEKQMELRALPRPVLAKFIVALLNATRDSSSIAQCAITCLGLVGAIAPSQITVCIKESQGTVRMEDLLHPIQLSSYILQNHLLRLLHSTSDPKMHDRAAFAIQSLIRICADIPKITLHELDGKRSTWWNSLSDATRNQLRAFVQTTYEVKVVMNRENNVPEYKRGMSFVTWLRLWFINLCSRSTGVYGQVFQSLRNVAKRDTNLCIFLFPFLVHSLSVYAGDSESNDMLKEVTAVLENADVATEHAQMLLDLLDTLARWSEREESRFQGHRKLGKNDPTEQKRLASAKKKHGRIRFFLDQMPLPLCIEAAHIIKAPARAVLYAENYMRHLLSVGKCSPQEVRLLQKVYAEMMEPDGIIGLSSLRTHTTEEERALDYESSSNWQDALQCNEILLQRDPQNLCYQSSLMTCMRNLGQFNLLLSFASSASSVAATEEERNILNDFAIQGAWRLSKWTTVSDLCAEAPPTFDGSLAKAMLSMHTTTQATSERFYQPSLHNNKGEMISQWGNSEEIENIIRDARHALLPAISAASMESYERAYPYLLQLHIMCDIEKTLSIFRPKSISHSSIQENTEPTRLLAEYLEQSRDLVEITPQYQEPVLATHRAILGIVGKPEETSAIWLHHSKVLRKFGMLPSALSAAMQARAVCVEGSLDETKIILEHAKTLYSRGDRREAIGLLENARGKLKGGKVTPEGRHLLCKCLLRLVRWNIDTNQKTPQEVESYFTEIINLQPSEKVFSHLGAFIESVYASTLSHLDAKHTHASTSAEDLERRVLRHYDSFIPRMLASYGQALCKGHRTVYKTLLKFLTRWLDTAHILHLHVTRSSTHSKRNIALAQAVLKNIHAEVDIVINSIPPHVYMTALPQLVSRIGHRNEEVLLRLRKIIGSVILEYPQQALWFVYFVVNSTNGSEGIGRSKVMREILQNAGAKNKQVERMVSDIGDLIQGLIAIASQPVSSQRSDRIVSLSKISGFRTKFPTNIIVPTQDMLQIQLPSGCVSDLSALFAPMATIHLIESDITIIPSLQKPKRITVLSSAGKTHHFLCKAKDETRKDSRMMEYSAMINRLLAKTPSGKLRKLSIRTFTVLPLSDDCGIIEWVPNLSTLRSIIDGLYAKSKYGLTTSQLKEIKENADLQKTPKAVMFTDQILPHFPAILHKWFTQQFSVPSQWFDARTAFTRTIAVMSVVGHVVGLGDRHGENLLIDTATGECVHVDFACLFDKGELLEVPERVRFRLTQNIVDAFGVTGVEGVFRKACEIALQTQMENRDTLMGILETFVHDPLVEWSRKQEKMDSRVILHRVEKRLKGHPDLYGDQNVHALNVEGVVQKLISSTTSVENLSQMYFWWMPWI